MASSLPLGTRVDREFVENLARQVAADRPLPWLRLQCGAVDSPDSSVVACYVVYVRSGGFMLCFSAESAAGAVLGDHATARELLVALHPCEVEVATARGRVLGKARAMLTDMPWEMTDVFSRGSGSRGSGTVVQFSVGGQSGRPVPQSVMLTADGWIAGNDMDATAAQDYVTGEEFSDDAEAEHLQTGGPGEGDIPYAELRRRVAELEAQVQSGAQEQPELAGPRVPILGGSKAPPPARQQSLFAPTNRPGGLDGAAWKRLQNLAGPPPGRGATSKAPQVHPAHDHQESVYAEIEKEVEDPQDGSLALLPELIAGSGDPLQKMLAVQMQQNALLLQKDLGNRQSDPILGVLAGSSSSSGEGGSGVKGCLAREVFQKSIQNTVKVGEVSMTNAMVELGMTSDRQDASVMRRYVERRIPLAEHKLLAHFATLLAEGWAEAYTSRNLEMMGFISKALIFTEQCALDSGKLPLAWLLTGYSEPNMQVLISHRHRPGLKPFSRLASPSWISANLAYLRDLDFLEGRMNQIGKPKPVKEQPDGEAEPKKKPKKPRGQPRGGDADAVAS